MTYRQEREAWESLSPEDRARVQSYTEGAKNPQASPTTRKYAAEQVRKIAPYMAVDPLEELAPPIPTPTYQQQMSHMRRRQGVGLDAELPGAESNKNDIHLGPTSPSVESLAPNPSPAIETLAPAGAQTGSSVEQFAPPRGVVSPAPAQARPSVTPQTMAGLQSRATSTQPKWASDGSLRDFEANAQADELLMDSQARGLDQVKLAEAARRGADGLSPMQRQMGALEESLQYERMMPAGEKPRLQVDGQDRQQEFFRGGGLTVGEQQKQEEFRRRQQLEQEGKEDVAAAPTRAKLQNIMYIQNAHMRAVEQINRSTMPPEEKAKAIADLNATKKESLLGMGVSADDLELISPTPQVASK
jgi:hypothetical protein